MAKKSVIVWPHVFAWILPSSGDGFYPEDTTDENAHLLLSESIADDDATYVKLTTYLSAYSLCFDIPTKEELAGIKLHFRALGSGTNYAASALLRINTILDDSDSSVSTDTYKSPSGNDTWETYTADFSSSDTFLQAVKSADNDHILALFYGGQSETTGGKGVGNADTYYTQAYVEFIYDDGESTTPLYLRENGAWTAIEGTVYQKVDGAWVESSTDVFQEGDRFELVQ